MNTSRNYLLLFVGCVLFHVLGTWNLPLVDRDEPRFAEASREMRERGDWIVPYFNGQYRFDKPPFTYWTQVASYTVFGESDFAARFPSAIAAGLVSVVILAWGSRMNSREPAGGASAQPQQNGNRAGLWAAIIFALSLQTFIHAKAAVADMWLVLFMTTAHWAGYELFSQTQKETPNPQQPTPNVQVGWWLTFYFSLALGFLAKGPIGWIPLATVAVMRITAKKPQVKGSPLPGIIATIGGICLSLVIISIWAVPAMIRTDWQFLKIGIGRHVIGRSIGAMEGHGANSVLLYLLLLPFYFVTIFVTFFPWSIKLPWLTGRLRRQADALDRYLLYGIGITILIFTLVATKLPHYILPAFPLLALLLARHWGSQDQSSPAFLRIALGTAVVWVAIALAFPPFIASSFPSWALFQKARANLRPEMEFGAVDYNEPSLVWYFRSRVHGFLTSLRKKDAAVFMAKPGPRFIVLPTTDATAIFTINPGNWERFQTDGVNVPKGKRVDLTLLLKPE